METLDLSGAAIVSSLPQTINGAFTPESIPYHAETRLMNAYKVTLNAGDMLEAAMDEASESDNLDCFLYLFEANGRLLTYNDDYMDLDSRIQYAAEEAGEYYVCASHYDYSLTSQIGKGYVLNIRTLDAADTVSLPGTVSGSFSEENDWCNMVSANLQFGDIVYLDTVTCPEQNEIYMDISSPNDYYSASYIPLPGNAFFISAPGIYTLCIYDDAAVGGGFRADIGVIHMDASSIPELALDYAGSFPEGGRALYSAGDIAKLEAIVLEETDGSEDALDAFRETMSTYTGGRL